LLQLEESWYLLDAGRAPGRPEVQQDNSPTITG
jgi:hypothetical protein